MCANPAYLDSHATIIVPRDLEQHACLCNSARVTPEQWRFEKADGDIQKTAGKILELRSARDFSTPATGK